MATLTLDVPDDLLRAAEARLGGRGCVDVHQYLLNALEALGMDGEPIDAQTEAKLLEGLASPSETMTEADWSAL